MKQQELFEIGKKMLKQVNIEEYTIKAKLLLMYVLKQTKEELVINSMQEVEEKIKQHYINYINQLLEGKPLQYITHSQEFMGISFYVDENVLIPQPDTEILVEKVIEKIKHEISKSQNQLENTPETTKMQNNIAQNKEEITILDLCTGSGCIAISLAYYLKNAILVGSDISKSALQIAEKNAILNNVQNKITWVYSNLWQNLQGKTFKYIVSNPPYIEKSVIPTLPKEVQNEPLISLDGGEDGLQFYKAILNQAANFLEKDRFSFFRNWL